MAGDTVEREHWLAPGAGQSWWHRLDLQRTVYRAALIASLLVGAYFRSRRYWIDPLGLWVDEATWALRLFRRSLTELEFRSIGYMALTKLIISVHCDERTLRLLSYVAGLASLPITADLSKHLFESRVVRVLCVAVVAYNFLRAKAYRALLATVCAAIAALAVIASIYFAALRGTTQDSGGSTEHFWGKKYDVFYLPAADQPHPTMARLRWLARKYCDLAAFPGGHGKPSRKAGFAVSETPNKLAKLGAYAWLVLHGFWACRVGR